MSGFVYVMSNPAMPGLLKVGKSDRDPTDFRADELYSTGVPEPFKVEYFAYVDDHHKVEKEIHKELSILRPNKNREFFRATVEEVVYAIRLYRNQIRYENKSHISENKIVEEKNRRDAEVLRKKQEEERRRRDEEIATLSFNAWKLKYSHEKSNLGFPDYVILFLLFGLAGSIADGIGAMGWIPLIAWGWFSFGFYPDYRKSAKTDAVFSQAVKNEAIRRQVENKDVDGYLKEIFDRS